MTVLYLVAARCPNCEDVSRFVQGYGEPVGDMQDITIPAVYCPKCGYHTLGEWDRVEETQLERVPVEEGSA